MKSIAEFRMGKVVLPMFHAGLSESALDMQ
jgi:hypothetical protein